MFGWVVPFSEKFDVMVFGGPSFFRLEQDVVSDVDDRRAGATVHRSVRRADGHDAKKSQTGYNVGADATYILWRTTASASARAASCASRRRDGTSQMMTTDAADGRGRRAVRFRRAAALLTSTEVPMA